MRAWVLGASLAAFAASWTCGVTGGRVGLGEAHATTSVLLTLEELVERSGTVAVVEAVERSSRWEVVGESKRIVTYTRLVVHEAIRGDAGEEIWVRTLGGKVGKIGQHVAGEAQFSLKARAVVFLTKAGDVTVVTGMAQGHYPLVEKDGAVRLTSSPDTGNLVERRGPRVSARERLVGAKLADATSSIKTAAKALEK